MKLNVFLNYQKPTNFLFKHRKNRCDGFAFSLVKLTGLEKIPRIPDTLLPSDAQFARSDIIITKDTCFCGKPNLIAFRRYMK